MPPQHDTLMTQYLAAIPPSSFFYVFSSQKWLCEDDCEDRHMVQLTATLPIVREEYVRQLLGRRSLWLWGGPSCKRRFRICFGWPADGRGALHWWLSEMNSAHTALAFYSKALLTVSLREGLILAQICFAQRGVLKVELGGRWSISAWPGMLPPVEVECNRRANLSTGPNIQSFGPLKHCPNIQSFGPLKHCPNIQSFGPLKHCPNIQRFALLVKAVKISLLDMRPEKQPTLHRQSQNISRPLTSLP